MDEDLYAVLGVAKDAEPDEIKRAWREIARRLHPDRNPGDLEADAEFRRASAAWAVLSDPDKRLVYDKFGKDALRPNVFEQFVAAARSHQPKPAPPPRPPPPRPPPPPPPQGARPQAPKGSPGVGRSTVSFKPSVQSTEVRASVTLSLEEAARGAVRTVPVEEEGPCAACGGTALRASGRFCPACRGSGRSPIVREVKVPLPVSVDSGQTVRLPGEGRVGGDGRRGTLYVDVVVRAHPVFRRQGLNLYLDAHVPPGARTISVPTLEGDVAVDVPEKAREGQTVRVAGRGMPGPRGRLPGDLWVTLRGLA